MNVCTENTLLAIFRLELEKTIVTVDFSTFNMLKCNISGKKTFLNVGPNCLFLVTFGLELEKATVLWYFTAVTSNFSIHKVSSQKDPSMWGQNCLNM